MPGVNDAGQRVVSPGFSSPGEPRCQGCSVPVSCGEQCWLECIEERKRKQLCGSGGIRHPFYRRGVSAVAARAARWHWLSCLAGYALSEAEVSSAQRKIRENGVNDFYMELFKWWSLKTPKPSSVSDSAPEVVELDDSGDEAGDLSIIMEVKEVKSDPYGLDSFDACEEAATISDELREYATSTMAALNEAMESIAEDEYLEPEYPDPLPEDPLPLGTPTVSVEVPVPDQVDPETKRSVAPTVPVPGQGQPGMPPPAPVKGFQELDQAMTVKDVEEKIRQLKRIGI
eukprot:s265_g15.t1